MDPPKDDSVEDGSKRRLNSSTSTENTKCSIPELVGGHGPWQYRYWVAFFLASTCNSMYLFSTFPLSSTPFCVCSNASALDRSGHLNVSVNCDPSQCLSDAFDEQASSSTGYCGQLLKADFAPDQGTTDCSSNISLIMYAKCIYVLGILLSGLTIRLFMFKFGRKAVSVTSAIILLASAIAIGWSQNAATFLILRFIISIKITNIYLLSASSLMEVINEEYRLVYGLFGHIGWGLAHFLLPLIAWLAQNWIQFSITLSVIPFILGIVLCFIPESIEAFLSKGLWTRAQMTIRRAARANGCTTEDIEQLTHNFTSQRMQEEVKSLPSEKENFQKYFQLFLTFFVGFSASFLYFTSIGLLEWVRISKGTYFALAGTTEIASVIILLFVGCFFSLKHLWSVTTMAASLSFMLLYAKPGKGSKIFSTFPYLFTMFFASSAWTILLYRNLFRPFDSLQSKLNAIITCIAVCLGILAATATDFQKFYTWNPKLYVIYGIPNLTVGATIGFMPDRYFRF